MKRVARFFALSAATYFFPWVVGASLYAGDGPLSPSEALRSFRLEEGLRIELVASEPLVVNPVAMAFDERGGLYVVEGRGYPTPSKEGEGAGTIARLEDTVVSVKFRTL